MIENQQFTMRSAEIRIATIEYEWSSVVKNSYINGYGEVSIFTLNCSNYAKDFNRLKKSAYFRIRTINKLFARPIAIDFGTIEYEKGTLRSFKDKCFHNLLFI